MAGVTNILQQVQTYQKSELAFLLNMYCGIGIANKKFQNFQKTTANLGSSITFNLTPRMVSTQGLVATFQPSVERLQTLSCDQAQNVSMSYTNQDRVFNLENNEQGQAFMELFGKSATIELANAIEKNILLNAISSVPVMTVNSNGQTVPTGALHTESGPYRFFGDGVTAINSFGQLASAAAFFREYGAADGPLDFVLPNTIIPSIVNTGLSQFALKRNDDIANSWEIGSVGIDKYYRSNLLPIHTAGTVGNSNLTDSPVQLTLVSTNDPTGANITQLTFSGATDSDQNAVLSGDLCSFVDGVTGQPNMRYLTFVGHSPSDVPVQFRVTANAPASSGGVVVLNIFPALCSVQSNANFNLNNPLAAGMQISILPTHKAGFVVGGKGFFLAMPQLPDQTPFMTANEYDMETGASMRLTHGALFGQNQLGFVHDSIWGSTMVPEYLMRIAVPLTQTNIV